MQSPKRRAKVRITSADRPSFISSPTIIEGVGAIVDLCNDYLTSTVGIAYTTCHLVRPPDLSVSGWRLMAKEWVFSQSSRRYEIQDALVGRCRTYSSKKRLQFLGLWDE